MEKTQLDFFPTPTYKDWVHRMANFHFKFYSAAEKFGMEQLQHCQGGAHDGKCHRKTGQFGKSAMERVNRRELLGNCW